MKTVLLSSGGRMVAEATRGHDLLSLHRNWAEEKADIWWSNAVETVRDIGAQIPGCLEQVVCIGCSGMVPAIVMLDEQGRPVRNTIQQNDARAMEEIEAVAAALDQQELSVVPGTVVLANTGVRYENVEQQLTFADGAVVGTTFKKDGIFENHVDEARVKRFMDKVRAFRGE